MREVCRYEPRSREEQGYFEMNLEIWTLIQIERLWRAWERMSDAQRKALLEKGRRNDR